MKNENNIYINIARKLGESQSSVKIQKWRLYCFLGEIHTAINAVYMGLQMSYLNKSDLSEPIREEIYDNETKNRCTVTLRQGDKTIGTYRPDDNIFQDLKKN